MMALGGGLEGDSERKLGVSRWGGVPRAGIQAVSGKKRVVPAANRVLGCPGEGCEGKVGVPGAGGGRPEGIREGEAGGLAAGEGRGERGEGG